MAFTLRTYAHLMPSSEDRAREAIEAAFAAAREAVNGGAADAALYQRYISGS